MPVPFSSEDLGRVFDARALTRGRTLVMRGAVTLDIAGDTISAEVEDLGARHRLSLKPSPLGRRVVFASRCSCTRPACLHVAAAALATLDTRPEWRRAEQQSFLANLLATPTQPRTQLCFLIEPGADGAAFFVTTALEDERTLKVEPVAHAQIAAEAERHGAALVDLSRLIGGDDVRRAVSGREPAMAGRILQQVVESGRARWRTSGRVLKPGGARTVGPVVPPSLALLSAGPIHWYVDTAKGEVGPATVRRPAPAPVHRLEPARPVRPAPPPARRPTVAPVSDMVIVERPMTPSLRLVRIQAPDDLGRMQLVDALDLSFDYEGASASIDDERQFVRVEASPGDVLFVRRSRVAETEAVESLRADGFVQIRLAVAGEPKGRRIFAFRGRDAAESWQRFMAERVPALGAQGWRCDIDPAFGPQVVDAIGEYDARITDAGDGWFSLELGIEIDGVRVPLLPILTRLLDQGGMDAARVVDGKLHTTLDDGRIVALPADRIARMLATMSDLVEAARRSADGALLLPAAEAAAVLDLEDLLTTRWQNAAAIRAYVERFRDDLAIEPVPVPAGFQGTLRPYQQHGLSWLQHLRAHEMAGILADDMGLGKTAQTIAHLVTEHEAGRLDRPALIVMPTSLVANWSTELKKFAPGLRVAVHHGLARHERRDALGSAQLVLTTYTVLTRDIEILKEMPWHMVVLDEAQAIKSPESKTTQAVCQLDTRHRLCLSGTPIENNLEELWSQFAFLMPGLLGDRRSFSRRFRGPIEKKGDVVRRGQLARRIRPFILRRTKAEVATELPPKHTIVRRISLAPEQRELYETIRVTLYDKVRHEIAEKSLARSRIVLLDALLKLRQVCCDPRLVKLQAAREVGASSKLDDLMEMTTELVAEGRRILLFSQFTSMLDLIKPALDAAGIAYVELRGDTADRATPVTRFEAGEVPLFLISLKAGGRGLNLTSADTVIHYDPWWNPAAEDQASDRAHRIGQTKSVFVYKLIAAGTVEERIVELQQRKAALANIALGGEGELAGIEMDDVDYLFAPEAMVA